MTEAEIDSLVLAMRHFFLNQSEFVSEDVKNSGSFLSSPQLEPEFPSPLSLSPSSWNWTV